MGPLPGPGQPNKPPENKQGGNWADLVDLALGSRGAWVGKGNLSQTVAVLLWVEREGSLARRRSRPSAPFALCCHLGGWLCPSL